MRKSSSAIALLLTLAAAASPSASALDNIVHEYMSVRSAGMGGVRTVTGLYEDNFFNNPARLTFNPYSKFELLGLTAEIGKPSNITSMISAITGGGDPVSKLAANPGDNAHGRVQLDLLNYFLAPSDDRKWGLGFGIYVNSDTDMDLRNAFLVNLETVENVGLNAQYARKLLNDKLSVGANLHGIFRASIAQDVTFDGLVTGTQHLSAGGLVYEGFMVDFDLGAMYELPILQDSAFRLNTGLTITNILGGNFNIMNNLSSSLCTGSNCQPVSSPRALGVGFSLTRALWGPFENTVFAIEADDIGADSNSNLNVNGNQTYSGLYGAGGLWRTIHVGAETRWKVFLLRAGINQGYLCAGLGFDFRYLILDFATDGEEMSLNSGGQEDRRWLFKLGLQF